MNWIFFFFFLVAVVSTASVSSEYLMGGHMDNSEPSKSLLKEMESSPSMARTAQLDDLDLDLDAEESTVVSSTANDGEGPRYRLPYSFAFNGGLPFSLEKDPITGKIDFEKAPPVKALNYTDRYQENSEERTNDENNNENNQEENNTSNSEKTVEGKDSEDVSPNEINPYSPNFHDFLNLPVHYSSDKYGKDKYPLISSSYANTKVQSGSNSYNTYNHRPYHGETVLHYPTRKPYVPKPAPTIATRATVNVKTSSTTAKPTTSTTTMSSTTMSTSTTTTTTPRATTAASSTKAPVITTWKPSVTSTIRYTDHKDDYDGILPIEKLQASMYPNSDQNVNNIVQNQDTESGPVNKNEEYTDNYEEYEISEGEEDKDYYPLKESSQEMNQSSNPSSTSMPTSTPITEMTSTTVTMTSAPSSTTERTPSVHQDNVFSSSPIQFQVLPQRPVTSMPIDSKDHVEPSFFDSIDNRRNVLGNVPVMNTGYRPNQVIHQRPGSPTGGILVESTSNIIIPPDQDTVSFVLGNRQNVEGGYYSLGTAIGENPYSGPSGIETSFRPVYGSMIGSVDKTNYDMHLNRQSPVVMPSVVISDNNPIAGEKWGLASPPSAQKLVNEIETARPQTSLVKGTVVFEPQEEKKEEKDSNYVVFPSGEESKPPVEEHLVIINEADGSIREIPPSTTTMKPPMEPPVSGNKVLPQLSEDLTPPAERPRPPPPFYYHYHHGGTVRPEYPRPQRIPLPPRGKQPLPPSLPGPPEPSGIRRRPYTSDSNLPNILPQFRPNAKTSHGHRGSETIGTIPAGQSFATRVRPPLPPPPPRRPMFPPPSYLQRLNPPPPPIHALRLAAPLSTKPDNMVHPRDPEQNIQRFRIPPVAVTSRGEEDAKSAQVNRLPIQKMHLEEEDRSDRYSEEPPSLPPKPPLFPNRRTADSPHIATLQMIQHHGELETETAEQNLPVSHEGTLGEESERILTSQEISRRKLENPDAMGEAPVYVVYPVNTAVNIHPDDPSEKDESVVVGTRGPHRPLPPETLLQDGVEDEMIEEENPPIHNRFNSRPPVASDFPYPLERPDASIFTTGIRETPLLIPSDQHQDENVSSTKERNEVKEDTDTSINIIPYLQDFVPFPPRKSEGAISATLHRFPAPSSTPIAYAYTPSAQASHRLDEEVHIRDDKISKADRNDQKPVLLPSQQPSSSSSSAPSPQNFMAPFVASLSAEAPSKNGWSVVSVEPSIDRKSDDDHNSSDDSSENENSQTEKAEFDPDNFKPQLFGGFKPIYEFPMDDEVGERRMDNDNKTDKPGRLEDNESTVV